MNNLDDVKGFLSQGKYTCVIQTPQAVYTSTERGVKPLVKWLESGENFSGGYAADKVVGKGAAFLYARLNVQAVYANVISVSAVQVLQTHGIAIEYDKLVDYIINRKGDGICPFEETVLSINDADAAYTAIRQKMADMHIDL